MESAAIFGPFFATLLLTLAVWVYMYVVRIRFIRGSGLTPGQLAIPGELARVSPAHVSNPSDNFKNLFEIPVLFYVLALYLHQAGQVDALHVTAAWIFVLFRALHSAVHCTINIVMLRFWMYLISTAALWFMMLRAAWAWAGR